MTADQCGLLIIAATRLLLVLIGKRTPLRFNRKPPSAPNAKTKPTLIRRSDSTPTHRVVHEVDEGFESDAAERSPSLSQAGRQRLTRLIHQIELYSYQLMPNHYHLVLRPLVDGEMSRFMGWVGGTHAMRCHTHYHTSGQGHVYQQRYKSFPIQDDAYFLIVCRYVERNALRAGMVKRAEDWRWGSIWRWLQKTEPAPKLLSPWPLTRLPGWGDRVNSALSEVELAACRLSAQRGKPMGDDGWVESIARRLNLESTMRPQGRKRVRFPKPPIKEAELL